ncbi:MAG: hypothetical protein HY238_16315 [Acidobacteria bacterium]|nr:hypothetical protein [Acidobacteriota bacterium]
MTSSVTFEEIERNAERVLGYALLTKTAQGIAFLWRLAFVSWNLDILIKVLSPSVLENLSDQQADELTDMLREAYVLLVDFCKLPSVMRLSHIPPFRHWIGRLRESTEELGEILDDLTLSSDPNFKELVGRSIKSLGIPA